MIKKVMEDYKVLLRSIPAATVSLFFVSVIMMNLLANKELISLPYLAPVSYTHLTLPTIA